MSKGFWGVIAVIVLLFVGVIFISGADKAGAPSGGKANSSETTSHIQGKGTTGVTLVEYGDYQCPYCQQYYLTVKQVQAQYNDKIKFQFRNFPIMSAHPNAFAAARAAEAASLQNKFWEMHDYLYETVNWQNWTKASNPNPFFEQYAKQLGLNVTQFKKDFASKAVNTAINADIADGNSKDVTGTPSFFVDGKKIEIANDVASFEKVIDEAIAKKASSGE